MDAIRMLNIQNIMAKLEIGRTTLHKLRKNNGFPAPALTVGSLQRWKESDVDDWILRQQEANAMDIVLSVTMEEVCSPEEIAATLDASGGLQGPTTRLTSRCTTMTE